LLAGGLLGPGALGLGGIGLDFQGIDGLNQQLDHRQGLNVEADGGGGAQHGEGGPNCQAGLAGGSLQGAPQNFPQARPAAFKLLLKGGGGVRRSAQ
jgi:hypothetical protein